MRSFKIIPVLVLLTFASPAHGQTVTYSLLGHQRQIGPLEQSLYSTNLSFQRHLSLQNLTSPLALQRVATPMPNSARVRMSELLGSGYLGWILGAVAGGGITYLLIKPEEPEGVFGFSLISNREAGAIGGAWIGGIIGSTIGVFHAGKKRGATARGFVTVFGSIFASFIPPLFIWVPVGTSWAFTLTQRPIVP